MPSLSNCTICTLLLRGGKSGCCLNLVACEKRCKKRAEERKIIYDKEDYFKRKRTEEREHDGTTKKQWNQQRRIAVALAAKKIRDEKIAVALAAKKIRDEKIAVALAAKLLQEEKKRKRAATAKETAERKEEEKQKVSLYFMFYFCCVVS